MELHEGGGERFRIATQLHGTPVAVGFVALMVPRPDRHRHEHRSRPHGHAHPLPSRNQERQQRYACRRRGDEQQRAQCEASQPRLIVMFEMRHLVSKDGGGLDSGERVEERVRKENGRSAPRRQRERVRHDAACWSGAPQLRNGSLRRAGDSIDSACKLRADRLRIERTRSDDSQQHARVPSIPGDQYRGKHHGHRDAMRSRRTNQIGREPEQNPEAQDRDEQAD